MIIKNLWIISRVGICYYHFSAPFTDYQIDEALFSGFIAGFSSFADSLSTEHRTIDYLKLSEDELYFETMGEIIVAAIMTTSGSDDEKLQPFSMKVMLQFIGNKFLELYVDTIQDLNFEWKDIHKEFTVEIQKFLLDKSFLEEIKREHFQTLFNKAISNHFPLDILYWRGIQLFSDLSPEGLKEALNLISTLSGVATTLVSDESIETKLLTILNRLEKDLKSIILEHKQQKLLIICDSSDIFEKLSKILLSHGIHSIYCPNIDYLKVTVSLWSESNGFDILSLSQSITSSTIRSLHEMDLKNNTKIVVVANKIPRPPKGRLLNKKPITFIIQESGFDIDSKSPVIDYIITSLTA